MTSEKMQFLPIQQHDLKMILNWRNAPEVRSNMYTRHEISFDEHCAWYEKLKNDKSRAFFIATLNHNPVGVIGFSEINLVKGIATWAFYASPEAPRGTGSLMEYSALEYAFNELKLHKLRCEVLGFNKTVVKLHTKFGFVQEGTLRDAFYDGESYHDIIHMGIFAHEWQAVKPTMQKKLKLV